MSSARMEIADLKALAPEIAAALSALSQAALNAGIEKGLAELIKVRISQMNGCTFCLQFHINLAREYGVTQSKLDQLAAWRESPIYSSRERLGLHAAEALTTIAGGEIPEEEFEEFVEEFGEKGLAGLLATVGVINAWNRFGMTYRFTPPVAK